MSEKLPYCIVYQGDIRIFQGNVLKKKLGYGHLHTSSFANLRAALLSSGAIEKNQTAKTHRIDNTKEVLGIKDKTPRCYQDQAVSSLTQKNRYTGILKAPTGSGKGNIIAYLIAKKNVTTLVIVPTLDLVSQTAQRIKDILDIDEDLVGEFNSIRKDYNTPILVSTWQSIQNKQHLAKILKNQYTMLICDEVHKSSAKQLFFIVSSLNCKYKYGLSATIYKSHEYQLKSIYSLFGGIVHTIEIEELYKDGFLLRPEVYFIQTGVSISISTGIRAYFFDKLVHSKKMRYVFAKRMFNESRYKTFTRGRLKEDIVNRPEEADIKAMAQIAASDYAQDKEGDEGFKKSLGLAKSGIDIHPDRMRMHTKACKRFFNKDNEQGIALFNTIEAGKRFYSNMKDAGYENIILLNGKSFNKSKLIAKLREGEIFNYIIVSTVSLLSEGHDFPTLEKVYVGSPYYPPFIDLVRLEQIIGRVVRPDPNNPNKKPQVLIIKDTPEGWIANKESEVISAVLNAFNPKTNINYKG